MDKVSEFLEQDIIKQSPFYEIIKESIKKNDYDIFSFFSNIEKLEVFLIMQNIIEDEQLKIYLFRQAWIMAECNYMYIDEIKKFFLEYKDKIMTQDEKFYLEILPEKFTIYRGVRVSSEVDKGISWSVNKKTAEKFINMPKAMHIETQNGRTSPFIHNLRKKRINKKDVVCYINERNEDEIIYWEQ